MFGWLGVHQGRNGEGTTTKRPPRLFAAYIAANHDLADHTFVHNPQRPGHTRTFLDRPTGTAHHREEVPGGLGILDALGKVRLGGGLRSVDRLDGFQEPECLDAKRMPASPQAYGD